MRFPPSRWLAHVIRGSVRYGPLVVIEVFVFWLILMAVDESGYGPGTPSNPPEWSFVGSFVIVALAMSAGEARFHLYRRVWSVASVNDAFAVGLAVIEATLLVTIINLLFPDGYRPVRVLSPIFAAPASIIAVGLIRLAPRLRLAGRASANRLLVVIPDGRADGTGKALLQQANPERRPVAVVTVNGLADVGQTVMGVPVMGSTADLKRWIRYSQAQGIAFV